MAIKQINYKYPHLNDLNFQKKIALKKEFRYPYTAEKESILNLDKQKLLCKKEDFRLSSHQEFMKNFIHPNTPYNGIILYHGMGTGKTCTAIGITEQFRNLHTYDSNFKKIWVIASPNVQDNFKLQLFDSNKLIKKNGIWTLDGCVGPLLLKELRNYNLKDMPKDAIINKIQGIIKKNYIFVGYEKFANIIQNLISNVNVSDKEKRRQIVKEILNKKFGNCFIVVDEAHNIRMIGSDTEKKTAKMMQILTTFVKRNKILLLTGTPMFNDSREIIFLLNFLRQNDGLKPIKTNEVFDKDGNFLIGRNNKATGRDYLIKNANGYISYIRGEDPYKFPFKIYPSDYNSEYSIKKYEYPVFQFNGDKIQEKLTFLDLHVTRMNDFQKSGYEYIKNKSSMLRKKRNVEVNTTLGSGYKDFQDLLYALNICFPGNDDEPFMVGKTGLSQVVIRDDQSKFNYVDNERRIFDYKQIGNYSAKIKSILDNIKQSDGIILIYSQYIDAGLIPIALALEEMGFKRIKKDENIFSAKTQNTSFNILTMKQRLETDTKFKQAQYSMITGDVKYSKNNAKEIELINSDNNINGEQCKVVLISQAGSEGIDFKNLRQVHILEPWYNLNRIEQIIGRAIRNCSHKQLPLTKRNCQIFLHTTYYDANEETIDMMLYRRCESKAKKIGEVQKALKEISVDCILNHSQSNGLNLNETLDLTLSTKPTETIDYVVKDKPYSLICDYQNTCGYKCFNNIQYDTLQDLDKSTFTYDHTVNIQLIERIKNLFSKKHVFKRSELLDIFQIDHENVEELQSALTYLIRDKNEYVTDKFGRNGRIINVKDLYIFQPDDFDNSYISLFDKMRQLKHKPYEININLSTLQTKQSISTKHLKNDKLITKINHEYMRGLITRGTLQDKSMNYYETFSLIINFLNSLPKINISDEIKQTWLVEHIVETLFYHEEVLLLNYLFDSNSILSDFEILLKKYFDKMKYKFLNGYIFFVVTLSDKKSEIGEKEPLFDSHVKILFKGEKEKVFRNLKKNEKLEGQQELNDIFKREHVKKELLGKYVVFMGHYNKSKNVELKYTNAKEIDKNKKNKGRFFINESPKTMIPVLNDIIGNNVIHTRTFTKQQLVVILELLSKYYTTNDNVMYLNKLQNAGNNIKLL